MVRKFVKDSHLIYEFFEEEGILFSLNNYLPYIVNKIAFKVLEFTNGERNEEDIIKIIAEEYKIDKKKVRENISNFYNNLLKRGIVHPI
jgi:hypothetical protein